MLAEWSKYDAVCFGLGPIDDFVCFCQRRDGASLQTAEGHLRPGQRVTVLKGYAVPGWTNERTRYWLDSATGPKD